MKNTIAERVYDFLKNFPPFSFLTQEELFNISRNVRVTYCVEGAKVFSTGEELLDYFYVVKDGAIGLFREEKLVDECDEGDLFGLRALIRGSVYRLDAKAVEESIVYAIPSNLLEEFITKNTKVNRFLLASFAANTVNLYENENQGNHLSPEGELPEHVENLNYVQAIAIKKVPVTCTKGISIKEAAEVMTDCRVGSIIIVENECPIGVITDKDLRTKIATGLHGISEKVIAIMSAPVVTIPENISVAEAQIAMLRHKITHLCVTKDGTPKSNLMGVLSEHDIVVSHGENPSFLLKEIKRAQTVEKLKNIRYKAERLMHRYLKQHIPVFFVSKIITAINDALSQKIINLCISELGMAPPVSFAWLALGSQGRGEQLLPTDQDHALVFEEVPENTYDDTKRFFLKLAKSVSTKLAYIGFEYCPADMMASNPKWCLSLNEWQVQFKDWITKPTEDKIMLSTIFFDYRRVYGDSGLVKALTSSVFKSLERYEIFKNHLALNTLKNPPPLGFFRQFLVENDGEHKDLFDIKARAMMPLVDAARVLVLFNEVSVNSTVLRFEKLMEIEPQNKELYRSCIDAFKILLRFRTVQGLQNNDSGRFINLGLLNKSNRLKLKGCFRAIKDVQELIRIRFKLSQML